MKKLLKLFHILNKNNVNKSPDSDSLIDINTYLYYLIGVVIVGGAGYLCYDNADFLSMAGPGIVIIMIGFLCSVCIVVLGIFTLINNMYMSSDIEILITLPFSATQIAVLRVLSFFRIAFIGSAATMISACIGYSLAAPVSAGAWPVIVLTAVLVPIFVTAVTATLVILVMTFLKIFRSREALKVVGYLFAFVAVCLYLFLGSNGNGISATGILLSLASNIQFLKYSVPVLGCAVNFMASGNVIFLIGEILCTLAAVLVFFLVARYFYLKGAMSMQDAGKGKILTDADFDRYCKKSSPMKALIRKEFYMVRRNPVYLLYNFIVGALWPFLILLVFKQLVPVIVDIMSDDEIHSFASSLSFDGFTLFTLVLTPVLIVIASFFLGLQNIAFSSLSREGKSFSIMKQLPVSYKDQLRAKRKLAARVAHITISAYFVLVMIIVSIMLKFNFLYCIVPLIMVALYTDLLTNLNMYLGIRSTNVNWDDEKMAVKKPLSIVLLTMAATYIPIGITVAMAMGTDNGLFGFNACLIFFFIIAILMLVLDILLRGMIYRSGEKKIRKLRF